MHDTIPYDYWFYESYRKPMHVPWSELTGESPQPRWRTQQDLWYMQIYNEVYPMIPKPTT